MDIVRALVIGTTIYILVTPFVLFPFILFPVGVGASVMMTAWVGAWVRLEKIDRPKSPYLLPMTILLAIAFIGTATSSHLTLSLPKLLSLYWGMIGWLLLRLWGMRIGIWGSFAVFLAVGFGMGVVGVFSADWQPKLFLITMPYTLNLPDAPANGISLNQLAGTILYFWPLLLVHWRRIPFGLMTLLWGAVLVTTQSRTAWVAVIVVIAAYLFDVLFNQNRHTLHLVRRVTIGICLLGGIFLFMRLDFNAVAAAWSSAPLEVTPGSLDSLGMRREIWRWGFVALFERPLFGVGLGTFRAVIENYPAILPANFDIAHAHNIFLQVGLDFGMIGLAAYLYLLLVALRQAWQLLIMTNNPIAQTFGCGFLLTLLAIHTFGLLDALALGSKPSLLFWLLIALIEVTHDQTFAPASAAMAQSTLTRRERSALEPVSFRH